MKLGIWVGAFVLSIVMAGPAGAQSAPSPPSAATVLSNVQKYYANTNQLTAFFRQTVTLATFSTSKSSDGKLWVAKPSYFRLDYMTTQKGNAVVTKSFVFDGTTLSVIDHDNKQITQSQAQASVLPAAVSFLTGGGALSSQFNVALSTSGTHGGKTGLVLELTPKQPSAQYKQLFFVVDPANWRVKASIVVDSNGNTNQFDFFTPDVASAIKASWFQVAPASLPTYKLVQLQAASALPSSSASGSGSATPAHKH